MKCETCHRHLDAEKHTTYRFPKDMRSGSQENEQMVFCCYDCMVSWLFKHMEKNEVIRIEKDGEEKVNGAEETDKDVGGWF